MATSDEGGPEGRLRQVDDCGNTVHEGKTPGCASDDPMGQTDQRQMTWSESQGQMTILRATVQSFGRQMRDVQSPGKQMLEGFATESLRRQEDHKKMEKTMTAKMEGGFKSEQLARQQAPNEIKQMVNKDLDALKEEMKSRQMGSGSTVCGEASTGAGLGVSSTFGRPPALAS